MEVLIKVIQLILALTILVIVHEFGHFITARIFKTRVEQFYIFFNPRFSIFRCKKVHGVWRFAFFSKNVPDKYITHEHIDPVTNKKEYTYEAIDLSTLPEDDWRTDEDHTEFGIGWIPLGGFCKIAGMIDESMDVAQMQNEPQPWEFRSKPAWQRLIVMVGGVVMNVVLAYFIYTGLLISQGEQYLPTSEVNKYGIATDSLARELGFRDGDKILSIDGNYVEKFNDIPMQMILAEPEFVMVERNGEVINLQMPEDATAKLINHQNMFISYRFPFAVKDFAPGSKAKDAGMQKGDILIKVGDVYTPYYNDFTEEIAKYANKEIVVSVIRDNDTLPITIQLSDDAKLGIYAANVLELKTQEYSFIEAIPQGFSKTGKELGDYWKQLKLVVNPSNKAYENLGGFITIGSIFPDQFNWIVFWRMTAFLSIILAVMNILPIPALDGGHVLFLLYEIITRRKPSDKFMTVAQTVGLFILLFLLIYANGNDIIRLFR
ncbi:MAG: RIP metalloprotease RseP [Bacteroidales bacterium]|nr:RIP metalloprotease RseP [Bacteroidales bacterium]